MKKNNKYSYVQGTSTTDHGSRTYEIQGARLPSVTTILSKTGFVISASWANFNNAIIAPKFIQKLPLVLHQTPLLLLHELRQVGLI